MYIYLYNSHPLPLPLTGTVITLQVNSMGTKAIECYSSSIICRLSPCGYPDDGCGIATERYNVQLTVTRKNMNIKNGDTVVLKSTNRENNWIECNETGCILRQCQSNDSGDYNDTIVSNCSNQFLVVMAPSRNQSESIKTQDAVIFKHTTKNLYLNCLNSSVCMMYPPCANNSTTPTSSCGAQRFAIIKYNQ